MDEERIDAERAIQSVYNPLQSNKQMWYRSYRELSCLYNYTLTLTLNTTYVVFMPKWVNVTSV